MGGGVGTLAAVFIWALIGRFVFRMWRDFDQLRTERLDMLEAQQVELKARIRELEASAKMQP